MTSQSANFRTVPLAAALCAALALAPLAAPQTPPAPTQPAAAQTPPVYVPTSLKAEPGLPRTPDGHPDFQGVVWGANFFGLLQANPLMPTKLVLSEEEAKKALDQAKTMFLSSPAFKVEGLLNPEGDAFINGTEGLPIVRGERRSRLLVLPVSGKLSFTPEILKEYGGLSAMMAKIKSDNPEERVSSERCINMALGGIPPVPINGFNPRQFFQTPTHIVIHTEYGAEVRIIPFTDTHRPALLRPTMGDAIARWDGDTLVIETTHNPLGERFRPSPVGGLFINPDAKVIERYTRLGKDELLYQYTVEDPKVFAAPWLAEYSLYRQPFRMYESACHEGNYSLPNTLLGQRVADARAAAIQ